MIRPYSRVRCADNTGARELSVIRVLGSSTGTTASIGDVFIAAVKQAIPNAQVKKGDVVRAVVVRQTKEYRRPDGSLIRFDDNAAVLLTPQNQPSSSPARTAASGARCRRSARRTAVSSWPG